MKVILKSQLLLLLTIMIVGCVPNPTKKSLPSFEYYGLHPLLNTDKSLSLFIRKVKRSDCISKTSSFGVLPIYFMEVNPKIKVPSESSLQSLFDNDIFIPMLLKPQRSNNSTFILFNQDTKSDSIVAVSQNSYPICTKGIKVNDYPVLQYYLKNKPEYIFQITGMLGHIYFVRIDKSYLALELTDKGSVKEITIDRLKNKYPKGVQLFLDLNGL